MPDGTADGAGEALVESVGPSALEPVPEETSQPPARTLLEALHSDSRDVFADPWAFGHVKDREHVAGFVAHAFARAPRFPDERKHARASSATDSQTTLPRESWKIARLELVSLLKFESPAVYLSKYLPAMGQLDDAETRPLTAFEQHALEKLRAGETLVTSTDSDRIQMLGAVRASRQCLDCHRGSRGTLLGAFSYRLRRVTSPPARLDDGEPST
jgi:hypothetical protein